jgi:predicted PurR-regulated permease PerM
VAVVGSILEHTPAVEAIVAPAVEKIDLPDSWWRQKTHVALWLLVVATTILFVRYAAEVIVPFVLSGLLFYALDPAVDALQRWRVPRWLGALLVLGAVVGTAGAGAYALRDDVVKIVADLPDGARRLRALTTASGRASTMESLRRATEEIDRTAAEAAGPSAPTDRGVVRVQVEERPVRTADYLWSGSMGLVSLASYLTLVCFLAYFLLVADDLFKRKLVRHASATLAGKKITVTVLEAIGSQIEKFILVQIFTSAIVGVVTAFALWMLGLNNAAVWGISAGVLNSVPYFGPFIVTCGIGVIAFLQFGTISSVASISGIALLITTLEGWFLTPLLLGRAAQMNRVAIFAGLMFWTWMWGVWGTLLAVPMMMVAKAICDHVEDFGPAADFLGE